MAPAEASAQMRQHQIDVFSGDIAKQVDATAKFRKLLSKGESCYPRFSFRSFTRANFVCFLSFQEASVCLFDGCFKTMVVNGSRVRCVDTVHICRPETSCSGWG
jgi:hypothetical protein